MIAIGFQSVGSPPRCTRSNSRPAMRRTSGTAITRSRLALPTHVIGFIGEEYIRLDIQMQMPTSGVDYVWRTGDIAECTVGSYTGRTTTFTPRRPSDSRRAGSGCSARIIWP